MAWLDPVELNAVPDKWVLSPIIDNDIIKISHSISRLNTSLFTGTIAQAELNNQQELLLYDFREVQADGNTIIFQAIKPDCFTNRRIAFKANAYGLLAAGQAWNWSILISEFSTAPSLPNFISGFKLWLDGSGLQDKSGNNNNASLTGAAPEQTTGIDGQPVLRWNGSGTQELQIQPFLSGTTSATVYIVYTSLSTGNYNLIRTAALDDYWRFVSGAGYFGTFRNSRFEGYPSSMPATGSHLLSIHASNSTYEVIVDNVSKGLRSSNYSPGDRFRIAVNDKVFSGDIATILVYPLFVAPNSAEHAQNLAAIKALYPSLPFGL